LDQQDPQLYGPEACWQADDVPRISIEAAYHVASARTAQVFWKRFDDRGFLAECSLDFAIQPDGQFHTYTLDLASSANYTGATLTGLRFDPSPGGVAGDFVTIRHIAAAQPGDR
jgi:hypothetical protein